MAARAAPPELAGFQITEPGQGGMWACRPTAFGGGAAGIAGVFGRICNPPLQTQTLPFPVVGAAISRLHRTAGTTRLAIHVPGRGGI